MTTRMLSDSQIPMDVVIAVTEFVHSFPPEYSEYLAHTALKRVASLAVIPLHPVVDPNLQPGEITDEELKKPTAAVVAVETDDGPIVIPPVLDDVVNKPEDVQGILHSHPDALYNFDFKPGDTALRWHDYHLSETDAKKLREYRNNMGIENDVLLTNRQIGEAIGRFIQQPGMCLAESMKLFIPNAGREQLRRLNELDRALPTVVPPGETVDVPVVNLGPFSRTTDSNLENAIAAHTSKTEHWPLRKAVDNDNDQRGDFTGSDVGD